MKLKTINAGEKVVTLSRRTNQTIASRRNEATKQAAEKIIEIPNSKS
tara:strand:+ start:270 stop:410 length:141 start_codon:yes stop_codon:yes gene_type:complete